MIRIEVANSTPMAGSGVACQTIAQQIELNVPIQDLVDFCLCDYECAYEEKAFVNLSDPTNKDENDKRDLFVRLPDENGSVTFYLVKGSVETELNDDTYGTYYPLGFNTENSDKVGMLVDWNKVVQSFGHGVYTFKTVIDSFGSISEAETYRYRTYNYSDENADKTVRLKTIHNGYVENGLDYTGLNWVRYTRFSGKLTNFNPIPESERYDNIDRLSKQIQTNVITEHDLRIDLVPEQFFKSLFYDKLLADVIYISDYNLFNPLQKVRDLPVEWTENNSINTYPMNTKLSINIKVTEIDKGTLKRFYR